MEKDRKVESRGKGRASGSREDEKLEEESKKSVRNNVYFSAHLKHNVLVVFVKHIGGKLGLRGEFGFLGFLSHLVPKVLGFLLLRCTLGQGVLLRLTRGPLAALRAVGLASSQGRWG